MHFKPTAAWYWHYDEVRKRVMINLINESEQFILLTDYNLSSFYECDRPAMDDVHFNVDDATLFYNIIQKIQDLPYSNVEKIVLALHAVTACRFHRKPMRGMSGLRNFSLLHRDIVIGEVFSIKDEVSGAVGDVLVLDVCGNNSLCMVLATGLKVAGKSYRFHDLVVVGKESFIPLYKMNECLSQEVFGNVHEASHKSCG